jgi:hypothetical protein
MGPHHAILWHEDGYGEASYEGSQTPLRRPVGLRGGRDGGVLPLARGQRRDEIVNELSGLYWMVAADRRGPDGVPVEEVIAAVDRLLESEDLHVWQAIERIAASYGWSPETIRDRRYRNRGKLVRSDPRRAEDETELSVSRSEVITELKRLRDARRASSNPIVGFEVLAVDVIAVGRVIRDRYHLSLEEACTIVANIANWPVAAIMRCLEDQQLD